MTPGQRVARNKILIGKMLDLETPEITDKVNFAEACLPLTKDLFLTGN
jgi:hypothetical protein